MKQKLTEQSMLRCQGDHTGMTMDLEQDSKIVDEKSELLMLIKLLNNHHRVSLVPCVFLDSIELRKSHNRALMEAIGAVCELEDLRRQASLPIKQRDPYHRLMLSTWAWFDESRVAGAGLSTSTISLSVWLVWRRRRDNWLDTVERNETDDSLCASSMIMIDESMYLHALCASGLSTACRTTQCFNNQGHPRQDRVKGLLVYDTGLYDWYDVSWAIR